jgi:peptidoglycan/xylan/chitin deacetylase (PgdA/CDA1 family)
MLPTNDAYVIAEKYHPAWTRCSPGAKKLHARNSHQILGKDLQTPCDFVVCWSDGSGGTEQALRIAKDYNVPIYNFYENGLEELKQRLTRAD